MFSMHGVQSWTDNNIYYYILFISFESEPALINLTT